MLLMRLHKELNCKSSTLAEFFPGQEHHYWLYPLVIYHSYGIDGPFIDDKHDDIIHIYSSKCP